MIISKLYKIMKPFYTFILVLQIFVCGLTSCNNNDAYNDNNSQNKNISSTQDIKVQYISDKKPPLLDMINFEEGIICCYNYIDESSIPQELLFTRNTEKNTFFMNTNSDIKIQLEDSFMTSIGNSNTQLKLLRCCRVEEHRSLTNVWSHTYSLNVQTAQPIQIIRPSTDNCTGIPLCYYDDLEIEWNPDLTNENGVIVIAEWYGITIDDDNDNNNHFINIDILPDNGIASLNNSLFDNFPNEALINLWLLRGNVVTLIEDEQELYLEDIWNTTESTEGFSIYIQEHPDILPLMKNYAFISGAIAKQAIFLIREL